MESEKTAWDLRVRCMDNLDQKGRQTAPAFLAASDLLAVLSEEKIPVRISPHYRAAEWIHKIGPHLVESQEDWLLTEDQEWKDQGMWQRYEEAKGKIFIDYHRSQALAGLRKREVHATPFVEKWKALGYHVQEMDGHDHERILEMLKQATGEAEVMIFHTKLPKLYTEEEKNVDESAGKMIY